MKKTLVIIPTALVLFLTGCTGNPLPQPSPAESPTVPHELSEDWRSQGLVLVDNDGEVATVAQALVESFGIADQFDFLPAEERAEAQEKAALGLERLLNPDFGFWGVYAQEGIVNIGIRGELDSLFAFSFDRETIPVLLREDSLFHGTATAVAVEQAERGFRVVAEVDYIDLETSEKISGEVILLFIQETQNDETVLWKILEGTLEEKG